MWPTYEASEKRCAIFVLKQVLDPPVYFRGREAKIGARFLPTQMTHFDLVIKQQPIRGRMCGSLSRKDRRLLYLGFI